MPVLPLVGSSSRRPGSSSPEASAASIIAFAIRSLIEPVGFWPSSFAYSRDRAGREAGELDERRVPDEREKRFGGVQHPPAMAGRRISDASLTRVSRPSSVRTSSPPT